MRRGGRGVGIFSADYDPPLPWRTVTLRLRSPFDKLTRRVKEKEGTVGALTDAELKWLMRCVLAESQARTLAKLARKTNGIHAE